MNITTKSEFSKMAADVLKAARPTLVTAEGEIIGVWANPDEIIVLSDLHPTVRRMLQNRELRARMGMPSPTSVFVRNLRKKLEDEAKAAEQSKEDTTWEDLVVSRQAQEA